MHPREILLASLVIGSFVGVAMTGAADTENANLPGGTAIQVSIDAPADGEVFTIPPGNTSIEVPVSGMAAVGAAEPVADTTLVYVLDVSGSTDANSTVDCGGDRNGDGEPDFVLDCEIAGILAADAEAIAQGTVDEVGLVVFADNASRADMQAAAGEQAFTTPGLDVQAVAGSAFSDSGGGDGGVTQFTPRAVGQLTNFEAAVQQACALGGAASNPNVLILFLSDGVKTVGGDPTVAASACGGPTIYAFAVGGLSTCGDAGNPDSLNSTAMATGGTCTEVEDPSELATVIPAFIQSSLDSLVLSIDGGAPTSLAGSLMSGAVPSTGPTLVTYAMALGGVGPGLHGVTVRASGSDGGGDGAVADTHRFLVQSGVYIDVRPTSCPNPFKTGSRGVVPVAILGTATFDASTVDPSSVRLEGVEPLRWSLEDVAAPHEDGFSDPPAAMDCTTDGPDGIADLTLKFDSKELAAALDAGHGPLTDGQVVLVTLTGEYDSGLLLVGQDVIRIQA